MGISRLIPAAGACQRHWPHAALRTAVHAPQLDWSTGVYKKKHDENCLCAASVMGGNVIQVFKMTRSRVYGSSPYPRREECLTTPVVDMGKFREVSRVNFPLCSLAPLVQFLQPPLCCFFADTTAKHLNSGRFKPPPCDKQLGQDRGVEVPKR